VADPLSFEIPDSLGGERVDKAVAELLGVSRAQARALLDQGVTLDGSPARPADRVRTGAILVSPSPVEAARLAPRPVSFEVIHADDSLIVVDKPAGLVVHAGAGRAEPTLAEGLLHRFPELEGVGQAGRWGIVHRLDRDTSGVLLVARSRASYDRMVADLAGRRVHRVYTALVQGIFDTETGTIEAPVGRDPDRPTRRAVVAGGKPAVTHYEVVAVFPGPGLTLLEVELETGRTHQIRVHMAAIGHPVVGDNVYSTASRDVPRIFLHARRVDLDHPATGDPVHYESPLPQDLSLTLERLRGEGTG
jgi:23S rRNA pseudouridine1911/1915/1917 synthase